MMHGAVAGRSTKGEDLRHYDFSLSVVCSHLETSKLDGVLFFSDVNCVVVVVWFSIT